MKYFTLFIFIILILKNNCVNGISLKEKQCNYIKNFLKKYGEETVSDCCTTSITQCKNGEIDTLVFNKKNFKEIPDGMDVFSNIRTLTIQNCGIDKLPSDISKLTKLESLNILNNFISEIPKDISKLKNLEAIYIYNAPVKSIPKEIYDLPYLQKLHIKGTDIESIPDGISKLNYLHKLTIGSNFFLSKLPNDIYDLKIGELSIRNNPQVKMKFKFKNNIKNCDIENTFIICHQSNCDNYEFDSNIPLCSDYEKDEPEKQEDKQDFDKIEEDENISSSEAALVTNNSIIQKTITNTEILNLIPTSTISTESTLINDQIKAESQIQENGVKSKNQSKINANNNNVHNNDNDIDDYSTTTPKVTPTIVINNSNNNNNDNNNKNQEKKNNSRMELLLTIAVSLAVVIIISNISFYHFLYITNFKDRKKIKDNKIYANLLN